MTGGFNGGAPPGVYGDDGADVEQSATAYVLASGGFEDDDA